MAVTDLPIALGIFQDQAAAQYAIQELQRAGFSNDQIKYSINKGGSGILDGLVGMGLPHEEAAYYDNEFRSGRTIVLVRTNDRQQEAHDILKLCGGRDAENRFSNSPVVGPEQDRTIQLREEELLAQKQWVQIGELRIRKRVITEEKTFTVPVSREEVIIERIPFAAQAAQTPTPIDQQATAIVLPNQNIVERVETLVDGKPLTILVREEQVQIAKNLVVVEEITVRKQLIQETKTFSDSIQKEKLAVERTGNVHIQGDAFEDVTEPVYQDK